MAFCAWCGNQVPQVSYAACPRCGNPTNGSQRVAGGAGATNTTALVIGLIAGGLVLVAFIGIVAAIAIPNMMTAMQRSRQKRTMADMRSIATALEGYSVDQNAPYPEATSVSALAPTLTPKFIKTLPTVDGWGTPLRYECWPKDDCRNYAIASAGGDKTFEHDSLQEYASDTKTSSFDSDIVFYNGSFAQYPELMPGGRR